MEHGGDLLVLGVLFVIAYVLGRLGKLIGLPSIPIYMIIGLLASPHVTWFPLSFDSLDVELVAIFGLIFLLFTLGLEFDQDEFFGNARALLISGGTRLLINFGVGFAFGMMVGWGGREALIIAGMTATSSSAIVTKLLIELRRLANRETPVILGIAVVEDVFIAIYLAIVSVVISGETDVGSIVLELAISFTFLVAMFALARWGGSLVSRLIQTRDDELFTILFFGLAVAFGGIGELLGVSDAIGAFLIGLVLGATRFRARIEQFTLPLRDVFGAFFFLSFGLSLDPADFGSVVVPVTAAVVLTLVLNTAGGQLIAWINKLTPAEGLNVSAMLQNRGEFALILATLASAAGLDPRLVPFAGLYVLSMAVIGPVLAVNSERAGAWLFGRRGRSAVAPDAERDRALALAEAAMAGDPLAEEVAAGERLDTVPVPVIEDTVPDVDSALEREARRAEQARAQSDGLTEDELRRAREVDPEY
ncbi:cation:proton antiporter [Protaetiibacter mangrovi]|uniref:Cation:proton antiporter n=1 Tax=Protaetiibacter mangrovi TaxID=2970926 RepID=A0ABT1ZDC6_9MICO|nr:cation:proton antiporter [Protaetiibacter mangrovi]MCS0498707.1 cation:proton antiporter [Protaetiibacter mangrovi]